MKRLKKIKHLKPPKKLLLHERKNGLIVNRTEQNRIVAEYFKNTFYKYKQPIRAILPTQIAILFTADEI